MICQCQDWKENLDKVNSGFTWKFIHGMGGYDGKPFIFCPWCGERLTPEPEERTKE